jgi:hypothetical protein
MEALLLDYLSQHYENGFGMETTTTIPFRFEGVAGKVQLKWWKQQGTLIIKQIELKPVGKNLLTPAVQALLANPLTSRMGLKTVLLESVLSPELRRKLLLRGWKAVPYNEYNLHMEA